MKNKTCCWETVVPPSICGKPMTWELDADHPYCAEHEAILKQSQKRFAKQIAANEAKLAARAKKARIIERKSPNGEITYVIQQPHFLFRWWWVDAWCNQGPECQCSFATLDEAECALPFFDGTPCKETVVVGAGASTQKADFGHTDLPPALSRKN